MSDEREEEIEALLSLADELDQDLLDPSYPGELIDDELRAAGLDPEEVGREGEAFVRDLLEKKRRALRAEMVASVAGLDERLARAREKKPRSRAWMIDRVERAQANPRFGGVVAAAFRGRKPEEPSDEELAALVAKLEALGAIEDDDGDEGEGSGGA